MVTISYNGVSFEAEVLCDEGYELELVLPQCKANQNGNMKVYATSQSQTDGSTL